MEIKRSKLQFDPLKESEYKKLHANGCIVHKINNKNCELFLAPQVASFDVENANFSSIRMTPIVKGDIIRDVDTEIFKGVSDDETINVIYCVEVTIMNITLRQNEKFFTELSEAIDYYNKIKTFLYYNKIKTFLKAEVK